MKNLFRSIIALSKNKDSGLNPYLSAHCRFAQDETIGLIHRGFPWS